MAQALPRNVDVADQLELLADLLEIEGEASFRVLAYRKAATRIRETAGSVAQLAINGRAKDLPAGLLSDYERLLRARNGVAVAAVGVTAICGGCRVTIRPQAIQELKSPATAMMRCESCGRYLYWQE